MRTLTRAHTIARTAKKQVTKTVVVKKKASKPVTKETTRGRPVGDTYKKSYTTLAYAYVRKCRKETGWKNVGNKEKPHFVYKINMPQVDTFAEHIGVTDRTLTNWCPGHEEFDDAIEHIKRAQKQMLVQEGICGTTPSKMATFLLSANHGMVEKKETKNEHLHLIGELFAVHRRAEEITQARIADHGVHK